MEQQIPPNPQPERIKRSLGYRIGNAVDTGIRLVNEVNPLRYMMFIYKGIGLRGDANEWKDYFESGKYNGKRGISGGSRYKITSTTDWYGSMSRTWESHANHQGRFGDVKNKEDPWYTPSTFCVVAIRAFSKERNRLPIYSEDTGENPQEYGREIFRWRNVQNIFVAREYFEKMKDIYRKVAEPSISWEKLCQKTVIVEDHNDFDRKILRLRLLRHVKSNLTEQDRDINSWMDPITGTYHSVAQPPKS